ncbi:hypothetical protein N665_0201s0201 [Sinapis alba]|nr:hypothetical protein N665_0201s0201 [Sinapis alba]
MNVIGGSLCSFKNTLMQSFPVFSSSTTTASINLPIATVTARLYFFRFGRHRSVIRP